jgi:hypothetical protein
MITAQWNVVIQLRVLANLTPKRPERTRGERRLVTKYEANSPTKQRDLFQAT